MVIENTCLDFPNIINTYNPPLPNKILMPSDYIKDMRSKNTSNFLNIYMSSSIEVFELHNPKLNSGKLLPQGCYSLELMLGDMNQNNSLYKGTLRIQNLIDSVISSGDLYKASLDSESNRLENGTKSIREIPIYPIKDYAFYIRVISIERSNDNDLVKIVFELWKYMETEIKWLRSRKYKAFIKFSSDISNEWLDSILLSGKVIDEEQNEVGMITLGLVSRYLRRATLRIDKEQDSIWPLNNGEGLNWKLVFSAVGWDLQVLTGNTNILGPGRPWTEAELHETMLKYRDADLDKEWRYHLFCAKEIVGGTGNMYDHSNNNTNKIPREGAAIASHYRYPKSPVYTTVQGMLAMESMQTYFRTAVHEISHAMGLQHFWWDNGFMSTSRIISMDSAEDSTKPFPHNVKWSFANHHRLMLAHMPDIWVRPGGIQFGYPYEMTLIEPAKHNYAEWENSIYLSKYEDKQSLAYSDSIVSNQSKTNLINMISSIAGFYVGCRTMPSGELFLIEARIEENEESVLAREFCSVSGKLFKINANEKHLLNEANNPNGSAYDITLFDIWTMEIPKTVMVETEITIIGPVRWTNSGHLLTEMMIRIELDKSVPKEIANISYVEIGQEAFEGQLKHITKSDHRNYKDTLILG